MTLRAPLHTQHDIKYTWCLKCASIWSQSCLPRTVIVAYPSYSSSLHPSIASSVINARLKVNCCQWQLQADISAVLVMMTMLLPFSLRYVTSPVKMEQYYVHIPCSGYRRDDADRTVKQSVLFHARVCICLSDMFERCSNDKRALLHSSFCS